MVDFFQLQITNYKCKITNDMIKERKTLRFWAL
jgi:hypothetical protein